MKNIIYTSLALLSVIMISCEPEDQEPIFDSSTTSSNRPLVGFVERSVEFGIERDDAQDSLIVVVGVSKLSDSDRTYDISINDELSTADPLNYEIQDTTVTIPAGQYAGELLIEGGDVTLTGTPQVLVLDLTSRLEEDILTIERISVNLVEFCPVPDDFFVGEYRLDPLDGSPFGGANPYFFPDTVTVEATGIARVFSAETLVGGNFLNSTLRLVCGEIVYAPLDIGFNCGGSAISYNPASALQPYDQTFADDSMFFVTFRFIGGCADRDNQLFLLTKL